MTKDILRIMKAPFAYQRRAGENICFWKMSCANKRGATRIIAREVGRAGRLRNELVKRTGVGKRREEVDIARSNNAFFSLRFFHAANLTLLLQTIPRWGIR